MLWFNFILGLNFIFLCFALWQRMRQLEIYFQARAEVF